MSDWLGIALDSNEPELIDDATGLFETDSRGNILGPDSPPYFYNSCSKCGKEYGFGRISFTHRECQECDPTYWEQLKGDTRSYWEMALDEAAGGIQAAIQEFDDNPTRLASDHAKGVYAGLKRALLIVVENK